MTQVNYATLTNRGFNTPAGALGFGLVAAAGVVTLGFGLAGGGGGFTLIFGLAFIITGLLMAVAVWRGGCVALIRGAVLSFLLLAVHLWPWRM